MSESAASASAGSPAVRRHPAETSVWTMGSPGTLVLTVLVWTMGSAVLFAVSWSILFVDNMASLFLLGSIVNVALSITKVGLAQVATHRRALMADAVHGLGDTVAEVVTALAYHEAAKPPDREHPWGHGKIESVGAIAVTGILLYIAASMGWDSFSSVVEMFRQRQQAQSAVEGNDDCVAPGCETGADACSVGGNRLARQGIIAVTLASVLLKEALFSASLSVGELAQSKLAVATAWHHRSDSLAAGVALASQVGASCGHYYLDSLGGGFVAAMLAHSACSSLSDSLDDLLDYNPASEGGASSCGREVLAKSIVAVQGVRNHTLRTRRMGPYCLVDVTIKVDARISASAASMLAESVHNRVIGDNKPFVTDVLVHVDPDGSPQSHDLETHAELGSEDTPRFAQGVNPDEVETRVRAAIQSLSEAQPSLPRIVEITELQTYYYADDPPAVETSDSGGAAEAAISGRHLAYVDVKVDIRLDMDATSLRSAAAVARAVRRRVRAELPVIRDVDVDLELDELEFESASEQRGETDAFGASPGGAVGSKASRGVRDPESLGHGFAHAPPSSSSSGQTPSTASVCVSHPLAGQEGAPSHGSWGLEPCVSSSTSRPAAAADSNLQKRLPNGQPASTERQLQQVTLLWERGLESRQARVPTLRFSHGVSWRPHRGSWLDRFRELPHGQGLSPGGTLQQTRRDTRPPEQGNPR